MFVLIYLVLNLWKIMILINRYMLRLGSLITVLGYPW